MYVYQVDDKFIKVKGLDFKLVLLDNGSITPPTRGGAWDLSKLMF